MSLRKQVGAPRTTRVNNATFEDEAINRKFMAALKAIRARRQPHEIDWYVVRHSSLHGL